MGIFGFLSKAHNDQNLVSGDVQSKIAIYDEKIRIQKDNIESARKALQQMDSAVDQTMARSTSENGADKATAIRRSQSRERGNLQKEISTAQGEIVKLNDLRAPIAAEVRKVEAEVGPIKYIAKLIYGDNPDANILEKAVVWVILMIVAVFDPLALVLILAAQQSIRWARGEDTTPNPKTESDIRAWFDRARKRARFWDKQEDDVVPADSTYTSPVEDLEPVFDRETEIPDYTDYSEGDKPKTQDPEPEEELPVKKQLWSGFSFPMSSIFNKPTEEVKEAPVLITRIAVPESNVNLQVNPNAEGLDASEGRPGDYVEQPVVEQPPVRPANPEASPGRNRHVMHSHLEVQADNVPNLGKASHSDFGNTFPEKPEKGDVYLRTDFLPNRLFKFNGNKWIEVDKNSTDVYAYEEAYIQHLINEIDAGRYDPETLTDTEQQQIADYLGKNAQ
jgi:hypothetical protein